MHSEVLQCVYNTLRWGPCRVNQLGEGGEVRATLTLQFLYQRYRNELGLSYTATGSIAEGGRGGDGSKVLHSSLS